MDPPNLSMNPNSLKNRFARNFVRSLVRIHRQNHLALSSSSSSREIFHRYHRVKVAADKSMARAAGSRRFWSRAILWRTKNQNLRKGFAKKIRIETFLGRKYSKEIKSINSCRRKRKRKKKEEEEEEEEGLRRDTTEELRKHIPGGGAMDLCLLLRETEHYIKCLSTQVEVMRNLADCFCSM